MQLNRLSLVTLLALGNYTYAQDELSFNLLYYHENDDRVTAIAPFLSYDHESGTDLKWHIDGTVDVVSGATPTWSGDGASGASANITTITDNITYTKETFSDQRGALNSNVLIRDEERNEYLLGGAFSKESDYQNLEIYGTMTRYFDEFHNTSYNIGLSYANNYVGYKSDDDESDDDSESGASPSVGGEQNIFTLSTSLTQNINDHSVFSLGLFGSYESGYLSNIHLRVARDYVDLTTHLDYDNRPSQRATAGTLLKYIVAIDDNITLNSSYRFYYDTWEMNSHTFTLGSALEIGAFTLSPEIRYYNQSAAYFYSSGHFENSSIDIYASSDERLSNFSSMTYLFNSYYKFDDKYRYNIGINYFTQTTGLSGYFITTGINIKL